MKRIFVVDLDNTVRRTISGRVCPNDPDDQVLLPNVYRDLWKLKNLGNTLVACSTQGGVSHGYISEYTAWRIAEQTNQLLDLVFDDMRLVFYKPDAKNKDYYYDTVHYDAPKAIEIQRILSDHGYYEDKEEKYYLKPVFVGDSHTDKNSAEMVEGVKFFWSHEFFGWDSEKIKQTEYGFQYVED